MCLKRLISLITEIIKASFHCNSHNWAVMNVWSSTVECVKTGLLCAKMHFVVTTATCQQTIWVTLSIWVKRKIHRHTQTKLQAGFWKKIPPTENCAKSAAAHFLWSETKFAVSFIKLVTHSAHTQGCQTFVHVIFAGFKLILDVFESKFGSPFVPQVVSGNNYVYLAFYPFFQPIKPSKLKTVLEIWQVCHLTEYLT